MSTVLLKDVTKIWPDGTVAVNHVSLDVDDGEFLVLLGPSGCGKSTILRMIAGLEDPSEGDILLNGDPVLELAPRDRSIAMVFQEQRWDDAARRAFRERFCYLDDGGAAERVVRRVFLDQR